MEDEVKQVLEFILNERMKAKLDLEMLRFFRRDKSKKKLPKRN
jgi:hypothetical protein